MWEGAVQVSHDHILAVSRPPPPMKAVTMVQYSSSMWLLMSTSFLLMPSWFEKNEANAWNSEIPPWVARDINSKCLTSPGYPDNYPHNSDTNQTLSVSAGQSIEITFKDFNVESDPSCRWDYVEFSDGNGNVIGKKLCGISLPQKFTIATSTASVLFYSDGSERRKGFKFCYKPGNINNKCLTSPGYPDNYPHYSDEEQTMSVKTGQSIEITFQDFNVESDPSCRWDYVEFSDGNGNVIGKKLCGVSLPQKFTISTSTASVLFYSDRSERRKGFKFCYKPGPSVPTNPPIAEEQLLNLTDYHNYDRLVEDMDEIIDNHPDIAAKYSIGQSVEGRDLLVMRLTSDAASPRPLLRPMVKFLANMHGDEAVGRELMLGLIRYLTSNYGIVNRVTELLDNLDIHILPSINPDGFEKKTRKNANHLDLNRAFPDIGKADLSREDLIKGREPEVVATINWILDNPFVASINFHDGAVVANYPWDDHIPNKDGDSYTEDHQVFLELSTIYANNHKNMYLGNKCQNGNQFPGGITNGYDWYWVKGGMQDFNYFMTNCMEITVELSCIKYPDKSRLQVEWENNKNALLSYLEAARGGVSGMVKDRLGKEVVNATVRVEGINKHVVTSSRGEYWRLLTKGTYRMRAVSEDGSIESLIEEVTIGDEGLGATSHQLNFTLLPANIRI